MKLVDRRYGEMNYIWGFKNALEYANKTNNMKEAVDQLEGVEVEDNFQDSDQKCCDSDTSIDVRNDA
uniref:Uncharacterized protein n=1 Tax=Caenorhabditis japonica TaxID=281687 RepID=A0A8R1E895_CAEJA